MKEPIYIFDAIWEKRGSVLIDRKHSFYDAWAETWESNVGAFQSPDCEATENGVYIEWWYTASAPTTYCSRTSRSTLRLHQDQLDHSWGLGVFYSHSDHTVWAELRVKWTYVDR